MKSELNPIVTLANSKHKSSHIEGWLRGIYDPYVGHTGVACRSGSGFQKECWCCVVHFGPAFKLEALVQLVFIILCQVL
jgi:hypothetical protein